MNNVTIEVYAKSKKTTDLLGGYSICKVGNACVIRSGLCFSPECPIEARTKFVLPIPKVQVDDLEVLFLILIFFFEKGRLNFNTYINLDIQFQTRTGVSSRKRKKKIGV